MQSSTPQRKHPHRPPDFTISTPRLQITFFHPINSIYCAFLVQLWNTDDFIGTCGRTSINTSENAALYIRKRILPDYACNRYGIFLVSIYDNNITKPVGTVPLMERSPAGPHYLISDLRYAVLPKETGKRYSIESVDGVLEYARVALGSMLCLGFVMATSCVLGGCWEMLGWNLGELGIWKRLGELRVLFMSPGMGLCRRI